MLGNHRWKKHVPRFFSDGAMVGCLWWAADWRENWGVLGMVEMWRDKPIGDGSGVVGGSDRLMYLDESRSTQRGADLKGSQTGLDIGGIIEMNAGAMVGCLQWAADSSEWVGAMVEMWRDFGRIK